MRFFNIDKGLELPQKFNIMHDALDELYAKRQEDFQKSNPLKEIYKTFPLTQFQKSFGSSTGFKQAFEQTVDYASYPGFTNGDGFKTTISYKAFNGKIVFTWQLILEGDTAGISQTLAEYQLAWQRQIVEFGIFALTGFFGGKIYDKVSKTYMKIESADTTDGDTMSSTKNPVFTNAHTIVRSEGMSTTEFNSFKQSNKFFINIKLNGSTVAPYQKLANALYQIKVRMNKYFDDNGKRAGVGGRKKLVMTEDAHLNQAIKAILAADNWSSATGKPELNPVKDGFDTYFTPYLDGNMDQAIPQFAVNGTVGHALGILMLDPEYNNSNKGPMMVERLGFSMNTVKTTDPEGIKYLGKQAFDFYCPSWRGIAYIFIGNPTDYYDEDDATTAWADPSTFTEIVPVLNLDVMHTIQTGIEYAITLSVGANGAMTASKATAAPGETVALTITPDSTYEIASITVGSIPLATTATSFVMPNSDVTVTVAFVLSE